LTLDIGLFASLNNLLISSDKLSEYLGKMKEHLDIGPIFWNMISISSDDSSVVAI
jgi:hypothetical protein